MTPYERELLRSILLINRKLDVIINLLMKDVRPLPSVMGGYTCPFCWISVEDIEHHLTICPSLLRERIKG